MANILIVDDNLDMLQLTARFLQAAGHSVTTAGNGREAMRTVTKAEQVQTGFFNVVITDLIMPEQEGLETIMALRRNHPDIKIIAMSGGSRTDPGNNLKIAQKLGASRILTKPFSGSELLAAVAAVRGAQEGPSGPLRGADGSP